MSILPDSLTGTGALAIIGMIVLLTVIVLVFSRKREVKFNIFGFTIEIGKDVCQTKTDVSPVSIAQPNTTSSTELPKYQNNTAFISILGLVSCKIKDAKMVAEQRGKLELPAGLYPQLLTEYQEQNRNCEIVAIAVYEQDEKFWAGYWGKKICETADGEKKRVFIVSNETQLYALQSMFHDHSVRYNVYAASSDQLRGALLTAPGWLQDFSIIDNKVVAYYNYGETVDPSVDKKIVFDISPDILGKKKQEFQCILNIAQQFTSDYTGKKFDQFARKVFRKKREISRYIDIDGYNQYEPHHPYYCEMHKEMLSEISKKIKAHKDNFKILEVGPGTGIFTQKYAGNKGINIDLVEIDSDCYEHLLKIQDEYSNVKNVINEDILEWNTETKYKIILSSFSNHHIPYERVQKFYERITGLLDNDGVFIFGEEFIPEHNMTENERKKSLYKYHTHIMSEALKQGHCEVAELENISLIQGIKKDGEYKVHLKGAKEEAEKAGLVFVKSKMIGPTDIDDVGGVFVVTAERREESNLCS